MKKSMTIIAILIAALYGAGPVFSQDVKSDDVLGIWLNEDEDAHIKVYQEGEFFFGKIIWLKDPIDEDTGEAKLDKENSDPELAKRPVLGIMLLKDFIFDEDEWEDGSIYDPKNGKTYDCYMELKSPDLLKIRGFIGISLLGRTTYWTRVE